MTPQERKVMELALDALQDYVDEYGPWSDDNGAQYVLRVGKEALAQTEQETNKNGSPCPEFWDWLPKAYNFEGDGNFTKYNMEVAFLAGKQASQPEQEPVVWRNAAIRVGEDLCSVAPFGYYDMTAQQWLDWALSVVTVHTPPPPPQRKPLTDEEIAVERALGNLLYWTERAVDKGNANLDIEDAMQEYNDALAAAHGIKGD